MKILNLYAGIGGNRKHWPEDADITAIEIDPTLAGIYKDHFPNDNVIVADAHEYLIRNFKDYDYIWSSPPCQKHSQMRHNLAVRFRGTSVEYPDMKLYEEIILLRHNFKGLWVVENVKPYYEPLIKPDFILQRHYYWSNVVVPDKKFKTDLLRSAQIPDLQKHHGYDLSKYSIPNKRQVLRNCVHPDIGLYIFQSMTPESLNKGI